MTRNKTSKKSAPVMIVSRPQPKPKKRRGGKRAQKIHAQVSSPWLSGSFSMSKQAAPAALGISTVVQRPQVTQTSRGERWIGASVMMEVPNTDGVLSVPIQPGLPGVFPWLATTAKLYSRYQFRRLTLTYVPRCGSGTNGQVTIAFNPDCLAEPPLTFLEAASYQGTTFGPVWTQSQPCHCHADQELYLRGVELPPDSDRKTYDAGTVTILMDDLGTDLPSPGFVIADYDIELFDRVLAPPEGCEILQEGSNNGDTDDSAAFLTNWIRTTPRLNQVVEVSNSENTNETDLGFPAGVWMVNVSFSSTVSSPPSSFYPFAIEALGDGLVFAVPNSQWVTSGSLSTGSTSALYLLWNPTPATSSPELNTDGWFAFTSQDDGSIIDNTYKASAMFCRCPVQQNFTDTFPGFTPKAHVPRALTHSYKRRHQIRRQKAATSTSNQTLRSRNSNQSTSVCSKPACGDVGCSKDDLEEDL